ncbi:DUF5134 domain-containing protein [Kitasatospora sp. McL0602]|uniref:DUF5134 domain-containing protein n=1 Tax=Kitasatospora sp. McL0602 TaxID=3439530 RepID=UPI003F89A009
MHGPAVVSWLLAALTASSGLYCLSRLRRAGDACGTPGGAGRWTARESDAAEAVMGLGMAAMALWPSTGWGWLYGLLAALLLLTAAGPGAAARRVHRLHHGIGAAAMAYMALAMAPSGMHHHSAPAGLPLLTGALLLYFGGYTLWTGSRLLTTTGGVVQAGVVQVGGSQAAGVAVSRACRLAMGVGMFAMLLTM